MANRFPWFFTVLWLVVLAVMLWAGFWQLDRAKQKQNIKQILSSGHIAEPDSLADWQAVEAFETVKVSGTFHPTHVLLANQIINSEVGYFVFTAFHSDGGWLLVNRGWVKEETADIDIPIKRLSLTGLVADWPRPGFQLGEQPILNQDRQVVTYLPQSTFESWLKARLCGQSSVNDCIILPRVLKLQADTPHGFVRQWQLPRMTAEKHRAYAAQWFTMSLVLCLVFGLLMKKTYFSKKHAS